MAAARADLASRVDALLLAEPAAEGGGGADEGGLGAVLVDRKAVQAAAQSAFDSACVAYAAAEHDDFFLLHGVTGAWALCKLLGVGGLYDQDDAAAAAAAAVHQLVTALIGTYASVGAPRVASLAALCAASAATPPPSWTEIKAHALANPEQDEHVFKLIFMLEARDDANAVAPPCGLPAEFWRWVAARKAGLLPWHSA
jgi:hypothetical protein